MKTITLLSVLGVLSGCGTAQLCVGTCEVVAKELQNETPQNVSRCL